MQPIHVIRRWSRALIVLALLLGPGAPAHAAPSQNVSLSGQVEDRTGAAVSGARVRAPGLDIETTTDAEGRFTLAVPALPALLTISAPGFADVEVTAVTAASLSVQLRPRGIVQTVTVRAVSDDVRVTTPGSATVLDGDALASLPAFSLDDQLRSVAGFSLFRRSSSRVANPTTFGVTLRGLAGSGASRTLVTADGVPLNDPFGGWVYWDRVPAAALDQIEVAKGGSSDAHGSAALAGAIHVETSATGARLVGEVGQRGTNRLSLFGGRRFGGQIASASIEHGGTDGYILTGPESRGAVDVAATSNYTAGFLRGGTNFVSTAGQTTPPVHAEVRYGYFTEDRGNGTPFQTNATVVRDVNAVVNGFGWGSSWSIRGGRQSQDYDQTFSRILAGRVGEDPTSQQHVDTSSWSGSGEWTRGFGQSVLLLGASGRTVSVELADQPLPIVTPIVPVDLRQRSGGVLAHTTVALSPRATVAAGLRADVWTSGRVDGTQTKRTFVSPRGSVAYELSDLLSFSTGVQRAYRAPTLNELFRDFRVGAILTTANPDLDPESSIGWEGSALVRLPRGVARATAFWTQLDDAILSVTQAQNLRQRQNAGRIRAAGVEFDADVRIISELTATASVAFTDSVFVEGPAVQGLRVPQVPRVHGSLGARLVTGPITGAAELRIIGRQFDDDQNDFELDRSAVLDLRAGWRPRRGWEIFVAVENALDEEQDVGRTPLRTLGLPRTARVGIRLDSPWR
jgi:outer membrane receptor protein involved in Fe transport